MLHPTCPLSVFQSKDLGFAEDLLCSGTEQIQAVIEILSHQLFRTCLGAITHSETKRYHADVLYLFISLHVVFVGISLGY